MPTEYTCITRKIEVHLHKNGDDAESVALLKEQYAIWNNINDNIYKAANRIVSHCFFNDAYEFRLRLHSPEFNKIADALKDADKNKLTKKEIDDLKKERKKLFVEFKKQRQLFLSGGVDGGSNKELNSTYKVVSSEFLDVIPSMVLTCLNQKIVSTYKAYTKEVERGARTIPNYKKGVPVPFQMTKNKELQLKQRSDGSYYVKFPKGLEWNLYFGRDRSNNLEIVKRILSGEYLVGDSSIQQTKKGKIFLLLVVKIPQKEIALDKNIVVGVDLGINIPLYAALNNNVYGGMGVGSRDQFLKMRMQMSARKREMQRCLRYGTNGGHGRKQKLQALERLEGKERNWVHLQNHIFSKALIDYALKNNAGVIQMEKLSGFGKDKDGEVDEGYKFILRNWSYFELQNMIEYKANKVGIEVRYVDPYHTSQTCSFCGHYEPGQRISQSQFVCKNPDCQKGKGKKRSNGEYEGINADWNAARNIALSDKIVSEK